MLITSAPMGRIRGAHLSASPSSPPWCWPCRGLTRTPGHCRWYQRLCYMTGLLGVATQGSCGFQGVFFFMVFCTSSLKDTWSASESLLSSPEAGFVIEYIDFCRVTSNDPPLLFLLSNCPSFFFFFTASLVIKEKENRGSHFATGILQGFACCSLWAYLPHHRASFSAWQQL